MYQERLLLFSACVFFLLIFFAPGCGNITTSSHFSPPETKLGKYAGLEITNFETQVEHVPGDALTQIPDETAKLLASKKSRFQKVGRESIQDIPAENTLVLLGEVINYQSGKDIKYEGGALKFGEVALTVQLALVQKNTGKEIATGEVNGFNSLGFTDAGLYKSMAEEIVKFINENY
jgi:hypothetical protein